MALFGLSSNKNVSDLIKKSKSVKKSETTLQKGGSLFTKIKNTCQLVESKLGHYAKELQLIQTKEALQEYITAAINNDIIAIDTETTGLDPITDQIVGACIYTYGQKPAYIPINHISFITQNRVNGQLTEQEVAEEFQRLADAKTKIIMFNAKFDIRVIRHQLGVYLIPAWCGFIAGKCLKNNEEEGNLKYLWKKYCSKDKEEEHFTFDKMFSGIKFNLIPISTAYLYAAKDALMTLDLYDFQKPYLTEDNELCIKCGFQKLAKLYNEIELPIIPIVADIEDTGVCIDVDYCKKLSEKYNKLLKEAQDAFNKELENYRPQLTAYLNTHPNTKLEDPINIASSTQLSELFYDVLQVPQVSKKSPRGTGEEILEKMGHPLGKLILNYRGIAKLLNTYIDKMPAILNKKTGRIHCSFNQYGTDCIIGDSHLVTNEGVFTFKELLDDLCIEDDAYYVFKKQILNKDRQWEQSAYAIKYKDVNTLKIKGQYGFEIEGTYNHPIMVSNLTSKDWDKNHSEKQKREFWKDKHFKQLDQIEIGDYIEVPCGWEWPNVDLIATNFIENQLKTHNTQELIYPKYFNEELAEFLGIYHADGHYRDTKDGFYVTIANQSMDVYNRLVYLCKNLFNVEPRREINGDKEVNIRIKLTHLRCLQNILVKGALNKRIPEQIRHSNKQVIKAYLKGMTLDSSRFKNKFLITVRNKIDGQFIQMFLCSQGILSALRDASYTYKQQAREMYRIALSGDYINKFYDCIGVIQNTKLKEARSNQRYKNILLDNSFRIKVESIEQTKNTVYDINVPISHSFICNSMINHNTGRFSSSDPNLQNIPSHNKDIRPMFMGTIQKDIKSNKQILYLFYDDIVNILQGQKDSQDLQPGDVLITDKGNITIQNVVINDIFVTLTLDTEQNVSVSVKRIYLLLGADYSQQEPKITADLSDDEQFMKDCASGKDAYATIASIAFNKPYEECLEFYLDENGQKTHEVNKAGKERRSQAKIILLGICYGKTMKSIAEDLNVTEEKATEIYNAVLTNISGLRHFMEYSQDFCRRYGYVETKWGRRRHIPDMMLPPFEITSVGTKNFDPFFDSEELGVIDDSEKLRRKYLQEISQAKYKQQKEKIKANAEKDGFKIKENTRKIEDATRQVVNARVQGSAADQTKIAMRLIGTNEKLKQLDFKMILLVHDEIIGECPFVCAKTVIPIFQQCMLDAAKDLRSGAKCDCEVSLRWYGKSFEDDELTHETLQKIKQEIYTVK